MASTLRQEFFLGVLPPGLRFSITQASVYCNPGGYNVGWRDTTNFNVSNMDGRCYSVGMQFPQLEPSRHPGKTCISKTNFSATMPANGQPVRLGEMTWSRANTLDFFAQEVPGWIELKFQISKVSGSALAAGSLKVTPTRFKTLERPDNVDINLTWDDGRTETTKTAIGADIGIDPPKVHLMFVPIEGKKALGAAFTQKEDVLNAIASVAVRGILYANKKVVEYGVPGGAIVIKIVEIPETIDTVRDVYDAGNDFLKAVREGNRAAALLAAGKVIKGVYDVGSGLKDIPGDLKGLDAEISNILIGKLPKNINDLPKDIRDDLIGKVVDEALKKEEQRQEAAKLRRRLARRKYLA